MKKIVFWTLMGLANVANAQIFHSDPSLFTKSPSVVKVKKFADYNRFSLGYAGLDFKVKSDGTTVSNNYKGLEFIYLHGFCVSYTSPLFIEVGGRLTYNTDHEDEYVDGHQIIRDNFLSVSVPVNVTYKITTNNKKFYFAPFVGLHPRFNLLANEVYNSGSWLDREKYNMFKNADFRRFQYGGQLGANVGYKKLNVGVGYYWDSAICKMEGEKIRTGSLSATIGVNF